MNCHQCNFELPENSKFCPECGAKQVRTCPSCSAVVGSNANFCGNCGIRLTRHGKSVDSKLDNIEARSAELPPSIPQKPKEVASPAIDKSRLCELSFVAVSHSIGSPSGIADQDETIAENPKAIIEVIEERLKFLSNSLKAFSEKSPWLNGNQSFLLYVLDLNGSGFGALLKHFDEPVGAYVKPDDLLAQVESRFEKLTYARIDVCLISTYKGHIPKLEDFHENDEAGEYCREIDSGVEIYVYDRNDNVVTYGSWDESGEIDEGYLDDPDDADWNFSPSWHKIIKSIIVPTPKT